jgi:hypothetical protein
MGNNIPLLIFIHIERCGGTTINHLMLSNYPGVLAPKIAASINQKSKQVPSYDYRPEDLKQLLSVYPRIRFIGGHHTRVYQPYQGVIKRPAFFFTFLRDPLDRYLSHLNYQRISMGINWTPDEFIHNPRFNNWQTFRIAGEQNLSKAKEYLADKMNFTGITEKFDESLVMMRNLAGLEGFRLKYAQQNRIRSEKNPASLKILKYDDLDNHQKNKLQENNQLDLELYEYALKEIFPGYRNKLEQLEIKGLVNKPEKDKNSPAIQKRNIFCNKLLRRYLKVCFRFRSHEYKY